MPTVFVLIPRIVQSAEGSACTCFAGTIRPRFGNTEEWAVEDKLRTSGECGRALLERELQPCAGIRLFQNASPTPIPKVWPFLP